MINEEESDIVNITVKNYNLENGMSQRLFHSEQQRDIYKIKGPMGKGLGLDVHT
jgi:hypothetical protein